jgi:hypothetical protein
VQQLTGKVRFKIAKSEKPEKKPENYKPQFNATPTLQEKTQENNENSNGENQTTFLKADSLPYAEKIKITRGIILDSYLKGEDGQINPGKIEFLFEHLKFKKPEAAASILLELIKIEQKEQDLIARNRNYGTEAKPPAPILIQINNSPGLEQQTPVPLTQEQRLEYLIEEHKIEKLETDLSDEEIGNLLGPSQTPIELALIRKQVARLDENEKKEFFADVENQKNFLSTLTKTGR